MPSKTLDPSDLSTDEDWEGNNAALTCPHCGKVFIVTTFEPYRGKRDCPGCGQSTGYIEGGKKSGGTARLEW